MTGFDIAPVAGTLHWAMKALLNKEITPQSVNAACNAAQQITQMIRVHIDATRLKDKIRKAGL